MASLHLLFGPLIGALRKPRFVPRAEAERFHGYGGEGKSELVTQQ